MMYTEASSAIQLDTYSNAGVYKAEIIFILKQLDNVHK